MKTITKPAQTDYSPRPVTELLLDVLKRRNETPRAASINAGLSHGAISSYLSGTRPGRESCLALAFYFGWNPNQLLSAAGHAPMQVFEYGDLDPKKLFPGVAEIAYRIQRRDHPLRERLIIQINALLDTTDAIEEEMSKVTIIGGET